MSRTAAFAGAFAGEHTFPVGSTRLTSDALERLVDAGKPLTLGELSPGVAHELNNPLLAILAHVEFLLRDAERGSRAEERLRLVQSSALEIKQIVRSLLEFARESADEERVVALHRVWAEATDLFRRTSSAKSVEVVERYPDGRTDVWGNPNQLKQIALNLLAGVQRAMPDGGTATIEVARRDGDVHGRVRSSENTPETGLGLALCRQIAQEHGGQLTATTLPDGGSCFDLRLPGCEPEAAR
jgi:signal transduction histidine kinase